MTHPITLSDLESADLATHDHQWRYAGLTRRGYIETCAGCNMIRVTTSEPVASGEVVDFSVTQRRPVSEPARIGLDLEEAMPKRRWWQFWGNR